MTLAPPVESHSDSNTGLRGNMGPTIKELGFKPGDKIRCVTSTQSRYYQPGDEFTVDRQNYITNRMKELSNGTFGTWEKVEEMLKPNAYYRCEKSDGLGFKVGQVYKTDANGRLNCDGVSTVEPGGKFTEVIPKFKAGDKVRYIPSLHEKHGRTIRTVHSVEYSSWSTGFSVNYARDDGSRSGWDREESLELVVEEQKPEIGVWQIWNGRECPVDPQTKVIVQLASETRVDAEKKPAYKAIGYNWGHWINSLGQPSAGRIIAYKIVPEPQKTVENATVSICGQHYTVSVECLDGVPQWDTLRKLK